MPTPVVIGIDNGGTWIRMVGLDTRGRRVWTLKKPSPTVENLPGFLRKHLRRFRGRLESLAVGSRGVWKPSRRKAVKRALQGLAKKIVVISDVEAAWLAAFGRGGQGIIVISGTGSIAYGRRADGTFARAGGLGPDKSDEGSGYWIGKEWIRRSGKAQTRRATVRQIADLAPTIIRRAQKGDPLTREVIRAAQIHLSALVVELIRELSWKRTVPVSLSGSVLENDWFQRGFLKILRAKKINFQLTRKKTDQAVAAL